MKARRLVWVAMGSLMLSGAALAEGGMGKGMGMGMMGGGMMGGMGMGDKAGKPAAEHHPTP